VSEIRSYRRVFDLERRIYSVDRLRLNPGGVPVRGVVYFIVILLGMLAVSAAPAVGSLARHVPWFLRDLAAPGLGAMMLTVVRVEGRPFHVAAAAVLRHLTAPRVLDRLQAPSALAVRWRPEDIVLLPDGSDATLRRLRYTGPGAVLVAVEHELAGPPAGEISGGARLRARARTLVLRQSGDGRALARGQVVVLEAGARLVISRRSSRWRRAG